MEFGPRLKQLRLGARKTQQELGAAIGSDVAYVSRLEKAGGPSPKRETIEAAAAFLGVSDDEREELLVLASHMPLTVQDQLATQPVTRQFLRSLSRLPEADQERLLRDMLREMGHEEHVDPNDERSEPTE
jgi:transcriptional regulator with XRE-family HTH domain